jgi:CheY-like chemotaxis protein
MEKTNIDLFIIDIDMPEMNGFELTDKIRANPEYEDTPIIYLTANAARNRILSSIEQNNIDFVVKPAYPESLLARVGKYLG